MTSRAEVVRFNAAAWDRQVARGNMWTLPVGSDVIERARRGDWSIVLTPSKPVPRDWFPALEGTRVLALASGGGQQGPILAAAGAHVTVFDNSTAQLEQDRRVAARDGLTLETVRGDMADLACFAAESFDLVFHPCSNCFVPDVKPVWKEAARVLRRGGALLAGVCNPVAFMVDPELEKQGIVQLRFPLPYSDLTSVTEEERVRWFGADDPLSFGHTLEDQLGGQCAAGLAITGLYEDAWQDGADVGRIHRLMNGFVATRAIKL